MRGGVLEVHMLHNIIVIFSVTKTISFVLSKLVLCCNFMTVPVQN